jgi:hypothetical protein
VLYVFFFLDVIDLGGPFDERSCSQSWPWSLAVEFLFCYSVLVFLARFGIRGSFHTCVSFCRLWPHVRPHCRLSFHRSISPVWGHSRFPVGSEGAIFFGLCVLVSRRPESLVLRAYCRSRVALAATDLVWSPSDAPTRGSRSQLEFFRRQRPFPPRASRSCHLRPVPPLVFSIGCSPLRSPSLSLCGRLTLLFLPHSVLVSLPSQETMTVL